MYVLQVGKCSWVMMYVQIDVVNYRRCPGILNIKFGLTFAGLGQLQRRITTEILPIRPCMLTNPRVLSCRVAFCYLI